VFQVNECQPDEWVYPFFALIYEFLDEFIVFCGLHMLGRLVIADFELLDVLIPPALEIQYTACRPSVQALGSPNVAKNWVLTDGGAEMKRFVAQFFPKKSHPKLHTYIGCMLEVYKALYTVTVSPGAFAKAVHRAHELRVELCSPDRVGRLFKSYHHVLLHTVDVCRRHPGRHFYGLQEAVEKKNDIVLTAIRTATFRGIQYENPRSALEQVLLHELDKITVLDWGAVPWTDSSEQLFQEPCRDNRASTHSKKFSSERRKRVEASAQPLQAEMRAQRDRISDFRHKRLKTLPSN